MVVTLSVSFSSLACAALSEQQNPPPVKRQFRDPYGDWWDKQERRNYGEPVHEDNDILGIFSPEQYTHFKPGFGAVLFGTFVLSVLGLCAVIYPNYPDTPAVPRHFEGGLDRELGGKGAELVSSPVYHHIRAI